MTSSAIELPQMEADGNIENTVSSGVPANLSYHGYASSSRSNADVTLGDLGKPSSGIADRIKHEPLNLFSKGTDGAHPYFDVIICENRDFKKRSGRQNVFNDINCKKEQCCPDDVSCMMTGDNPHNAAHEFDGANDLDKGNEDFITGDIKLENQIKSEIDMAGEVDFKIEYNDERHCVSPQRSETLNNQGDPNVCETGERGSFSCWICHMKFTSCQDVKKHIFQEHDQKAFCALIKGENEHVIAFPSQLLLFCPKNCEFVTSNLEVLSLHMAYCPEPVLQREGSDFMEIQKHFISNHSELLKEKIALEERPRRQDHIADVEERIQQEDPHTSHTVQRGDKVLNENYSFNGYSEDQETVTLQSGQQEETAGQANGCNVKDSTNDEYSSRMYSPIVTASKEIPPLRTNFNPEASYDDNNTLTPGTSYGCVEENGTVKDSEFHCTRNHPSSFVEIAADVLKFDSITETGNKQVSPFKIQARRDKLSEHSQDVLNEHMRLHKEKITFLCEVCGKTFRKRRCLLVSKGIHLDVNYYACNVCSKIFDFSSALERHIEKLHHVCKVCCKSFMQRSKLLFHMRLHTGEKSNECNVCTLKFCEIEGVHHQVRRHDLRMQYNSCNFGPKSTSHSRLVYSKPQTTKPLNFRKSCSLQGHMRIPRRGKSYESRECNKRFAHKSNHFKHMRLYLGGKPFKCHSIQLRQQNSHNKHVTNDYNESVLGSSRKSQSEVYLSIDPGKTKFKCNRCGNKFFDRTRLLVHMREHEKPKFEYNCCGNTFYDRFRLLVHMKVHTGERPFICDQCGQRFSLKSNLLKHMRRHAGDRHYSCNVCGKEFHHGSFLKEHKSMHVCNQSHQGVKIQLLEHGRTFSTVISSGCDEKVESLSQRPYLNDRDMGISKCPKPFLCEQCGMGFYVNGGLINHMRTHVGVKPFQCEVCGKSYKHKGTLKTHMTSHTRSTSTGEMPYQFQCEQCGKAFLRRGTLRSHMRAHSGERPFQCKECNKCFTTGRDLHEHMRMHTGEKPFQCVKCERRFGFKSSLRNHLRTHSAERPFQCQECGRSFRSRLSLKLHMTDHTGIKPFQCEECGKAFGAKTGLQSHMKTHSEEKPYQCTKCEKSYKGPGSLYDHMKLHTGEKPHKCEKCTKSFLKRNDLDRHMRTHTGEKPFQCDKCDNKFTLKSHLKRHDMTHKKDAFGKVK